MQELVNKLGLDINVAFMLIFYSLIWVRILGMAAMVPFLFGKPVPKYVMVGASAAMALFVYPNLVPKVAPQLADDWTLLAILYIKEAFYGMTMGLAIGIIFHAFASVGQMIDNQRGMSIARILIPSLGQQLSISSLFLFQLGIVIFFIIGGHLIFFDSFFSSYIVLPVLEFPVMGPGFFPLVDLFITITGEVIFIALQMSAPVIIAIFLADLILGIANRVAPQINVWMLGFTLKGYVGILLMFISFTMIYSQMEKYILRADTHVDQVIELLRGRVPVDAPQLEAPEEGLPKLKEGVQPVITK
jgi:type III secretion protein SpaR/YscT/HrcT